MKTKGITSFILILLLVGVLGNSATLYAEHNQRSKRKSALIIGGSTTAGALLGGIMGGKKGAAAGAIAGGGGSAVYDMATRDRDHYPDRSAKDRTIIIGGSTAAGATAGGVAGGAKGALIGGMIGAAGGYVLDKKTGGDRRIF
jgi:hypothetical protein